MQRPTLRFLLTALALLASAGCQSEEAKLLEHFSSAEAYMKEKQFAEAIIDYKNVIQIDPKHADAHHGLARAYFQTARGRQGFWELRETVRLDSSNQAAKLHFGQLLINAGELEEALKQANQLVANDPSEVSAYLLKGHALEALRRPDQALEAYDRAVAVDAESKAALLLLARYHRRHGNREVAEPLYRKLCEIAPNSSSFGALGGFLSQDRKRDSEAEAAYRKAVELAEPTERTRAYQVLAGFYFARNRFNDSFAILEEGIEKEKDLLDLIYLLARLHRARGNEQKADELVERATEAAPENAQTFLILSAHRGRQGDLVGALEAVEQALALEPDSEQARLRKAELLVDTGTGDGAKSAEARVLVDSLLARQPSHPGALLVKAKLDLAEEKTSDAIVSLRAAIDMRPDWADAHFMLGAALALSGDRGGARSELARALEMDPGLLEARRILARVHAAFGEHEYVVEEGRRYLREKPDSVDTRILVAQSLVLLDQPDAALAEVEAVPPELRDAEVVYAIGRIHLALGHASKARGYFMAANAELPNESEILRSLLTLDQREERLPESSERILAAAEAEPGDATLQQLLGTVALLSGRLGDAEERFKRAVELAPEDVSGHSQLARFYAATGRPEETVESYRRALAVQPDSAEIHYALGVLYESLAERDKAAAEYEAAIESAPNLAEAKNNLAYIYADREEKLDRALDLAQEAKGQMLGDPNAADTLGWVLYKRGIPSAAISYLKEAEAGYDQGDANLGLVRHHLALAYDANQQPALARATLERALADYDAQLEALEVRGITPESEPKWNSEARDMLDRLKRAANPEQG